MPVRAQQPRRHKAVAAVVALADDHSDGAVASHFSDDSRKARARALHEIERRNSRVLDRMLVRGAHLGRLP